MKNQKNNLLWIRTPKCGSMSIVALFERCRGEKIRLPKEALGVYTSKTNRNFGIIDGGKVEQFKIKYPKFYDSSYSFAVIRNPFDRVVSSYTYLKYQSLFSGSFEKFVFMPFENMTGIVRWHSQPLQAKHLKCLTSIDKLVRFENLEKEISHLFKEFLLVDIKLPHRNKSSHKHYTEYYNDKIRQEVARKWKQDIEAFGYEFGNDEETQK
jgi:chondroitin 4-sulfotransferase 11